MHAFESLIDNVPNFPKPGIIFKDISPLLCEKFEDVITEMSRDINWDHIDAIVGIESRGFILAAGMASRHGKGFIPVRKKGKLPPPTISQEYTLEYGTDVLEVKASPQVKRILIVDDVLATGGTLKATIHLCKRANFQITDICVLIDLKFLNNLKEEGIRVRSVLQYS